MFRKGLFMVVAFSLIGVVYCYLMLQNKITALQISLPRLEQCVFEEKEKQGTLAFQLAQISSPSSLFHLMEQPEHQNLVQAEFVLRWTIFLDQKECEGG